MKYETKIQFRLNTRNKIPSLDERYNKTYINEISNILVVSSDHDHEYKKVHVQCISIWWTDGHSNNKTNRQHLKILCLLTKLFLHSHFFLWHGHTFCMHFVLLRAGMYPTNWKYS